MVSERFDLVKGSASIMSFRRLRSPEIEENPIFKVYLFLVE